jgi:hypothetical protein
MLIKYFQKQLVRRRGWIIVLYRLAPFLRLQNGFFVQALSNKTRLHHYGLIDFNLEHFWQTIFQRIPISNDTDCR